MALLLYQNALLWTGAVCKPIIELKDFIFAVFKGLLLRIVSVAFGILPTLRAINQAFPFLPVTNDGYGTDKLSFRILTRLSLDGTLYSFATGLYLAA